MRASAIGLIHGVEPAAAILRAMVGEAETIMARAPFWITA